MEHDYRVSPITINAMSDSPFSGKTLHFSQLDSFDQLFSKAEKWEADMTTGFVKNMSGFVGYKGFACFSSDIRLHMRLTTHPYLAGFISSEMVSIIGEDSFYFELIDHGDGTTLVVVNYNKILGSRWLAKIKTDTIPKLENLA